MLMVPSVVDPQTLYATATVPIMYVPVLVTHSVRHGVIVVVPVQHRYQAKHRQTRERVYVILAGLILRVKHTYVVHKQTHAVVVVHAVAVKCHAIIAVPGAVEVSLPVQQCAHAINQQYGAVVSVIYNRHAMLLVLSHSMVRRAHVPQAGPGPIVIRFYVVIVQPIHAVVMVYVVVLVVHVPLGTMSHTVIPIVTLMVP